MRKIFPNIAFINQFLKKKKKKACEYQMKRSESKSSLFKI